MSNRSTVPARLLTRTANLLTAAALGAGLLSGCIGGGGDGGGASATGGSTTQGTPADLPDFSGVFGYVRNPSGTGLLGATVESDGTTTETDADGYFELKLSGGGEAVVTVESDGYLPGIKRIPIGQEHPAAVNFSLAYEAAGLPLNASDGGTVTSSRGASMEAPAEAFVSSSGDVVSGEVQVHLTPIDPSDERELATFPGDMSATQMSGGEVMLESFGVLDVTVRADGEKVQIAGDKAVTIRIPAPSGGPTAPDTIALWSFDEASGKWIEEGEATLDAATNTYVAEIKHMSYWNCDKPQTSTCVSGTVLDRTGTPVSGAYISAFGLDYNGVSDATADENGKFQMLVRRDSEVSVQASHPAGGGEIMEITSQDVEATVPLNDGDECQDLGTFTIEAGTVTTASGEDIMCVDAQNPWAGTCASGFGTFASCFQPSGACTINITDSSIHYENGAYVETNSAGAASGLIMATYYGPNGQQCGSYSANASSTDPNAPVEGTFTLQDGSQITMVTDPNDSSQTITCANGQTVEITAEQQQVYQACVGDPLSNTDQCTIEGFDPGGGLGTCSVDSDCDSGSECCDFGSGVTFCLPQGTCPAM